MRRAWPIPVTVLLWLLAASSAWGFDSGTHADVTREALASEGFGTTARDVAQVNNWFIDLYENSEDIPFSGHSGALKVILGGAILDSENWDPRVVHAADSSHFDSTTPYLIDTPGIAREWDRLRRAVWTLSREARARNDPLELLTVLGMSLHQIQDFYTHTNWLEPRAMPGGFDGPGWAQRGYGTEPTWFDIPEAVRNGVVVYTGTLNHRRGHGGWNTDGNRDLSTAMNKDWPGRPLYAEAHIASYFATRQWVRAVRSWVADDAFWARAQRYADRGGSQLARDVAGSFGISLYSGHWQGQGEPCNPSFSTNFCGSREGPGGYLLSLRSATKGYFEAGKTRFRRRFEQLIMRMADPAAQGQLGPVASSQDLQRATRFVRLRVLSMGGVGIGGLGDPGPDDADLYARASIAGQRVDSAVIHGHDSYSFPRPNAPFTWIKAVSRGGVYGEPVSTMTVEIRTSSSRFSGTDDDVSLRINGSQRFSLDKRLYDDFERGDRDTYSVPIDSATQAGLTVGAIRQVQIEKSRDGLAGGWKLRGVKLAVNGRTIYSRDGIERWLEDDHRTWRAPDFRPASPSGPALPVWLSLREDDDLYGGDDQGDINRYDRRDTIAVGYAPGTVLERQVTGGSTLGGRLGDSDKARLRYRLDTIDPATIPVPQPPPPNQPPVVVATKPDLVVTGLDQTMVTVKNQGDAASGPFKVTVAGFTVSYPVVTFAGLAPGASASGIHGFNCSNGLDRATVDSGAEVAESNEANNVFQFTGTIIC